jgi:choline kinase
VTIDRKESYDEDDMKVVEEGGRLKAIGKRLELSIVNAESIGLLAFRAGGAERFREAIEHALRTPEGTTIWYLRVIHHLAQSSEVWTFDINGEEWGEVDFPPDVDAARELTARWDAAEKAAAA